MTREELESLVIEDITQIQRHACDLNAIIIALVYHRRQNLAGYVCFPPRLLGKEARINGVTVNAGMVIVLHPDDAPQQWTVIPRDRGFLPGDVEMPLTVWGYLYIGTKSLAIVCSASLSTDGKVLWSEDKQAATQLAETLADLGSFIVGNGNAALGLDPLRSGSRP
jgi:hypothetical protein